MRSSTGLILTGILILLGGVLALANPFAASLAVTTLVGIFLTVAGVLQLWIAFSAVGMPGRVWTGLVGLIGIIAGISLIANPLAGVVSLTLLVGLAFLFTGATRLGMAWQLRQTGLFWFLLLSGAVSVLIAVMVMGDFAAAASSLLGLMLGIQLLADGVGLVVLGLTARKM